MLRTMCAAIAVAVSFGANAQEISGKALALDGDTILVTKDDGAEVKVRLWGIDSPEMKVWPWGPLSRATTDLALKAGNDRVRCLPKGTSHERTVGRCFIDFGDERGVMDIGEWLIHQGLVVEHRAYSKGFYRDAEFKAMGARRGVWGQN